MVDDAVMDDTSDHGAAGSTAPAHFPQHLNTLSSDEEAASDSDPDDLEDDAWGAEHGGDWDSDESSYEFDPIADEQGLSAAEVLEEEFEIEAATRDRTTGLGLPWQNQSRPVLNRTRGPSLMRGSQGGLGRTGSAYGSQEARIGDADPPRVVRIVFSS
ncbi:hypothetical protein BD779DRAFT_1678232 [Infundibulicybe gibba]|nr:hypothetical protein BD779DRAFT_1678232 [Infundibulicybe gibba]